MTPDARAQALNLARLSNLRAHKLLKVHGNPPWKRELLEMLADQSQAIELLAEHKINESGDSELALAHAEQERATHVSEVH